MHASKEDTQEAWELGSIDVKEKERKQYIDFRNANKVEMEVW